MSDQYQVYPPFEIISNYHSYSTLLTALSRHISTMSPWSKVVLKSIRARPDEASIVAATHSLQSFLISHAAIGHPNIWPTLGHTTLGNMPAIVTPFCENGNVIQYCHLQPGAVKLQLILDIARGIHYLHQAGFAHQNINPMNILINESGRACLSDVGVFAFLQSLLHRSGELPDGWVYKPFEELQSLGHVPIQTSQKRDVYSLGSTIYEIFAGQPPFPKPFPQPQSHRRIQMIYRSVGHMAIRGHLDIPRPVSIDAPLWNIIQECWTIDAQMRPTILDVVSKLEQLI